MPLRSPRRFARLILLFALAHTLVPAMASIVDALAERSASQVVQMGEQGSTRFRPSHPADCALCTASAAITGSGEQQQPLPTEQLVHQTPVAYSEVRPLTLTRVVASQRAPPVLG